MREEISNELLLQVIQAWDPAEADTWQLDVGCLVWAGWGIRHSEKDLFAYAEESVWHEASKLVEFLLKDRPDLGLFHEDKFRDGVPITKCEKATGGCWDTDPWGTTTRAKNLVTRLKAYEYLREWKEKQELSSLVLWSDTSGRPASQAELERTTMKIETPSVAGGAMVFRPNGPKAISNFTGGEPEQTLHISTEYPLSILNGSEIRLKGSVPFDIKPGETLSLMNCLGVWCEISRTTAIDSRDVTLSIEGQTIEGMEICDDVLEVPAPYAQICSQCNGSKQVEGWGGKEKCRAC